MLSHARAFVENRAGGREEILLLQTKRNAPIRVRLLHESYKSYEQKHSH